MPDVLVTSGGGSVDGLAAALIRRFSADADTTALIPAPSKAELPST
jgi:hypothetical protein